MNCKNCKNYEPEVKEESLDQILNNLLYKYIGSSGCLAIKHRVEGYYKAHPEEIRCVRKDTVLEVFDKEMNDFEKCDPIGEVEYTIRKSLENL